MSDVEQRRRLRPRQSAVSRADLLWLLHVLGDEDGTEAAGLLGFRRVEGDAPVDEPMPPPMPRPPRKPEPRVVARRPPLRATHFAVVEHQSFPSAPIEDEGSGEGPIFESVASKPALLPPRTSLSPARRLAVLLRHQLRLPRAGSELDTARLLEHLARGRALPRHLPRLSRPHWGADAALAIDFSLPAMPLREDLIDLADVAHTLSAGRLTMLWRDPTRGWLQRQPGRGADWREVGEAPLVRAHTWLLAGNVGSLSPDPAASRAWRVRIKRHLRSGGEVAMLAGGFTPDWRQSLPRQVRLALWERGRRPVPGRTMATSYDGRGDVNRLLAALSLAVVVEPALLRDIRLVLGLSTACELAAWNHRHVENCAIGMQLRRDQLAGYRERLKRDEPLHVRQRLAQTIARHHAAHSQLIRMEEAALAAEIAGWQTELAREQWRMAARTLERAPASTAARELSSYLERTGLRAHPGLWPAVPALADAYVIARRDALRQGAVVPEGMPAVSLGRHLASNEAGAVAGPLWIVRRGNELVARSQPPEDGDFTLLESLPTNGLELEVPGRGRHWQALEEHPVRLDTLLPGAGPWTIRTPWVEALIAEIPRPSWALGWEFDHEGLHAWAPSPLGQAVRLDWFPPGYGGDYRWPPSAQGFNTTGVPIGNAIWMGADLEFGLYVDVPFGMATQRFRWIEPGEFVMGSPDTEPERRSNEGPQHVVRLTEGFWLADTACSQAVWEAVTGSNPSQFQKDPQNPVEQVSWDDVQGFLQKVGERLPGVKAELPTEAEWEYACRAGTETAFNLGDRITPSQANYDGRKAYADGQIIEYRERTIPVKSFVPNPWGLYQMHGNVWEWCADGMRPYDGEAQENPRGENGSAIDAPRVVRGGSWGDVPRGLRAAYSGQGPRDWRFAYLGFRFALRSPSPSGGAERPPEAAATTEGAGVGDFLPLSVEGGRGSYLDYAMSVIAPSDKDSRGPIPWKTLRETLVPSKAKRSRAKKGGKR